MIPFLRNTVGTHLTIEGSAGWLDPGGNNESVINTLAFERAHAVRDYVIKFGVPHRALDPCHQPAAVCRGCTDVVRARADDVDSAPFSLMTTD